jgi:DNA-binding XRE family transcriptional regulator
MENDLFIFRKRARLRQFDLAQKLGVTEQLISAYETGRAKVPLDRAIEIGRILKVDPKVIFPDVFKK